MASKNWVLARLEAILGENPLTVSNISPRLTTLENEAILVADTEQITDTTEQAGVGNAATLDLGDVRSGFDVNYDVDIAGSIQVDISTDGVNYDLAEVLETASGGEQNTREFTTNHQFIRVYANSNDFDDGDVTEIKVVSRGL